MGSPSPKRGWKTTLMRSGLVTTLILLVGLVVTVLLYRERGRGHLHQLTSAVGPPVPAANVQPGGKDVLTLSRYSMTNGEAPEFLSTTILPGVGMDIWQVKVTVPMQGESLLLAAPTVDDLVKIPFPPKTPAAQIAKALSVYGAPLLVWTSKTSVDGDDLNAAAPLMQVMDTAENHTMPDGGDATAVFPEGSKEDEGRVPPGVQLRVSTLMSGRALDVILTARNMTANTIPLRLGWMPHFAIPEGGRENVRLALPTADRRDHGTEITVRGSNLDFNRKGGTQLGKDGLNVTFSRLKHEFLSNGPKMELMIPEKGYMLRITALNSEVQTVRVVAPAGANWVSIIPIADSTDTTATRAAEASGTPAMRGLAPGKTMQMKVRLEVLQLTEFAKEDGDTTRGEMEKPMPGRRLRHDLSHDVPLAPLPFRE